MKDFASHEPTPFNTAIIVLVCGLYMLFSVGIVKATHFCMGREASVAFFTNQPANCDCPRASENDSCCDDKHELLKVDDSRKIISQFQLASPVLSIVRDMQPLSALIQSTHGFSSEISEMPNSPVALYKVYCTYVFYDEGTTLA